MANHKEIINELSSREDIIDIIVITIDDNGTLKYELNDMLLSKSVGTLEVVKQAIINDFIMEDN